MPGLTAPELEEIADRTAALLDVRPTRAPNHQAEAAALLVLAQEMADHPANVLTKLCDLVMGLCEAGSAGISILDSEDAGAPVFVWPAIAGAWSPYVGGGMPRHAGPCGIVVDLDRPLLFQDVMRQFPAVGQRSPDITETLLVPFHAEGKPVGAIWVLAHDRQTKFDREDVRLLTSLARFASAVRRTLQGNAALRASEAYNRQIFDGATDYAIIATDTEGRVTRWNDGAWRILGWTEEEILGQSLHRIFPVDEDGSTQFDDELQVARLTGRSGHEGWRIRRNGERFWASGALTRLLGADARIVGFVKVLRDRTDEHLTGQALQQAQDRLTLTLDRAQIVGLWDWHIQADTVFADERFARLYGVDPERAALGTPMTEFISAIHPDDRQSVEASIDRALHGGEPFSMEYRVLDAEGAVRYVLARGQVINDDGGEPIRFPGVTVDITDQRRAELAQRQSDERYRSLFDSIDAGFCIVELIFDASGQASDYRFLEVNAAFERQTDLRDAVGKRMRDLAPDHESHWFGIYGRVALTGEPVRFENSAEKLGGRWYDVHAFRIGDPGARQVAILFNDITVRRRAEATLRESEFQLRTLAEAMPNHVWTAARDGQLDWFNDRVYAYSGAAVGTLDSEGWAAILHPGDVESTVALWRQAVSAGQPYQAEFRLRRADGAYRWHLARAVPILNLDGTIIRWVGTNTDIEDQKAAALVMANLAAALEARVDERTKELTVAEAALRQSQKMEAIGQLTGGIAHDFNNLLTGIIGSLDLIQNRLAVNRVEGLDRFIDAASTSAQRAAALTHRLLAFARRQPLDVKPSDVNQLVAGMEDMLRRTLGEAVNFETLLESGLWPALTDANQLENALLNLAINARDAMPGGGRLTIETSNIYLDEAYARASDGVEPGDYVVIGVSDTGTGMPEDVVAKAFEPFFTTKPIGQGTGLGLSMIYGFARQSGGHVRIYSEVGRGTTVKLYLKRAKEAKPGRENGAKAAMQRARGETVLLVEDDAIIRLLVAEVLEDLGYNYMEAPDAKTAIPILQSGQPIDLLVTDVGLPNMNGRQLAEIAREARPDLKVLFITGYAEMAAVRGEFLAPGMEMMTKPFAMEAMAAKLRELIER